VAGSSFILDSEQADHPVDDALDTCCVVPNNSERKMVPLYAARIEDLGPGDFVKVDCSVLIYGTANARIP
jgi:hypothetical protein